MESTGKMDIKSRFTSQNARPTVGLLAPSFYDIPLWLGVADEAKRQDINLIWYISESYRSGGDNRHETDNIYNLTSSKKTEGIITWVNTSASESLHYNHRGKEAFLTRNLSIPVINYEGIIEGVPCVITDTYSGMCQVLAHLIEAHGCRRIALIRGPIGHTETEERVQAYTDTLSRYGLDFDEKLMSPPTNSFEADDSERLKGKALMNLLLHERKLQPKVDFDSVAATEAEYAIGAMMALQEQGIQVPYDIAVVGFNDYFENRVFTPPLTTVCKPFYESGQKALQLLLELLKGNEIPAIHNLPSKLVIRQSCGCFDPLVVRSVILSPVTPHETTGKISGDQWEQILAEIVKDSGFPTSDLFCSGVKQLVNAFRSDLEGESQDAFASVLDKMLSNLVMNNQNVHSCHDIISLLIRCVFPYISCSRKLAVAESLWQQARAMIGDTAWRMEAFRALHLEQQDRVLHKIGQSLIAAFDVKELMTRLGHELPNLDIHSAYVSVYEGKSRDMAKLILAFNRNGAFELDAGKSRFPSNQLAPDGVLPDERRYTMIATTLFFQEEQMGFALFEMGPRDGHVYTGLRAMISSSLKGAILLTECRKAEKELTSSYTELERFTYVASHDLQEPLRKVMFFSEQLISKYNHAFDERGRDYAKRMQDAVNRMQAMIKDLLTLSRITTKEPSFVSVPLHQVVSEALSDLEIRIKDTKGQIEIGELPVIDADPVQIRQLLVNLIGNSLKFHKTGMPPLIKVSGELIQIGRSFDEEDPGPGSSESPEASEWCRFFVRDNGIGFEEKYVDRIFQPFNRLHGKEEYEGHGIGLAICKKIVDRHHGRITAKSAPDAGATFIIMLPLHQLSKNTGRG